MNQIDDLKLQSDLASRSQKVISMLTVPLSLCLTDNCPDTYRGPWLAQTLANLVSQVLFTLFRNDEEKTKFYVEAVREALGREFYIEDN